MCHPTRSSNHRSHIPTSPHTTSPTHRIRDTTHYSLQHLLLLPTSRKSLCTRHTFRRHDGHIFNAEVLSPSSLYLNHLPRINALEALAKPTTTLIPSHSISNPLITLNPLLTDLQFTDLQFINHNPTDLQFINLQIWILLVGGPRGDSSTFNFQLPTLNYTKEPLTRAES